MIPVKIVSLKLENFGCFDSHEVIFDTGLNQIAGANESGKSTIREALMTALFEDGRSRKKNVRDKQNWFQNSPVRLEVRFTAGEKEYLLKRDYGSGQDLMTDSDGIKYEGQAITDRLTQYFGTCDRRLYEAITVFESDNPEALNGQKSKLKSALETPVFGGFDRTRMDQFLDGEIKKLENPRGHSPREIDELEQKIEFLKSEEEKLREKKEALNRDAEELQETKNKADALEKEIEKLERETAGAAAYKELDDHMANLEQRLQNHLAAMSRVQQTVEDINKIRKELTKFTVPAPEYLQEMSLKRDELGEAVEQSQRAMDKLIARRGRANFDFLSVSLLLVTLCLVYILTGQGYITNKIITDMIPYAIPVAAFFWILRTVVYVVYFRRKKKASDTFRNDVARIDQFYAALNEDFCLQSADPLKTLSENVLKKERLEYHLEYLQKNVDSLTDGKGIKYLMQLKTGMEDEIAQLNGELVPVASFAALAGEVPALKEKLTATRVRHNAYRERAASLAERCSVMDTLEDDLNKVKNEIEANLRHIEDLRNRVEIYKIIRGALNRAADSLIEDTFRDYSQCASQYLSLLTDKRYTDLYFNKDNDCFEILYSGRDERMEVGEGLSSSTRDAVYLALRMAAVEKLSLEFIPPVIFDQADIRMDRRRRAAYESMLDNLSERMQLVHIELDDSVRFDRAKVINMPLPSRKIELSPAVR